MTNVGTTPVSFGTDGQLIQNLGPDLLYVQSDPSVDATTGLQLGVGDCLSTLYSTGGLLYAVSAGNSEVRELISGTGIFHTTAGTTP